MSNARYEHSHDANCAVRQAHEYSKLKVTETMSPHETLLGKNPHLVDAWEDLCMGWPFAQDIVDALGSHISVSLAVVVRDRPSPLLMHAWRRALARYMLVARQAADPSQLTHEPFVAFVTELLGAISAYLADVELECPDGTRWSPMGNVALDKLCGDPNGCRRLHIEGDNGALQRHLASLSLVPPYDTLFPELRPRKAKSWLN